MFIPPYPFSSLPKSVLILVVLYPLQSIKEYKILVMLLLYLRNQSGNSWFIQLIKVHPKRKPIVKKNHMSEQGEQMTGEFDDRFFFSDTYIDQTLMAN